MDVFIDGVAPPREGQGAILIRDYLNGLRQDLGARGRSIISITLDRRSLSRQEQDVLTCRLEDEGRIDILTIDPVQTSLAAVQELKVHIARLEAAHIKGAEAIRAGNYSESFQRFSECFSLWQGIIAALDVIYRAMGIDPSTLSLGRSSMDLRVKALHRALTGFREAFRQADGLRVADIAEYELKPMLDDWHGIVQALEEKVRAGSGR